MIPAFPNGALGSDLSFADQRDALRRYVHRFTREHKPEWASGPWKDGKPYPVHFASDAEWLANTRFPVKANGRLAARGFCFSRPTWPDNPELRSEARA